MERLALVCFKNPSMTDTGTIYSNILLLYGVNDNDADDNWCCIDLFTSLYHDTQEKLIYGLTVCIASSPASYDMIWFYFMWYIVTLK